MTEFTPEEERMFLADIDDDALMVRGLESYVCLWYEHVVKMSAQATLSHEDRIVGDGELTRDLLYLEFQLLQVIKDCVARKKRLCLPDSLLRNVSMRLADIKLDEERAQGDPSSSD